MWETECSQEGRKDAGLGASDSEVTLTPGRELRQMLRHVEPLTSSSLASFGSRRTEAGVQLAMSLLQSWLAYGKHVDTTISLEGWKQVGGLHEDNGGAVRAWGVASERWAQQGAARLNTGAALC